MLLNILNLINLNDKFMQKYSIIVHHPLKVTSTPKIFHFFALTAHYRNSSVNLCLKTSRGVGKYLSLTA
jgi:hypothetical protein